MKFLQSEKYEEAIKNLDYVSKKEIIQHIVEPTLIEYSDLRDKAL